MSYTAIIGIIGGSVFTVSPMQVACLHLPRASMSIDIALRMTKFNQLPCVYMVTQLEELSETNSEPFALEFFATGGSIRVCIAASAEMIKRLSSNIYSYYPDVEIHNHCDYTKQVTDRTVTTSADLYLQYPSIYPLQNFRGFAWASLSPFFAALTRVGEHDRALMQMVIDPVQDTNLFQAQLAASRQFDRFLRLFRPRTWLKADLPNQTASMLKEKALARQFRVNYRIAAWAEPPKGANAGDIKAITSRLTGHVRNISDAVKVMNTLNENRFLVRPPVFGKAAQTRIQQRHLIRPFYLSAIEVASLWYPPGQGNVPNTELVLSKKAPASRSLPSTPKDPQISFIGTTNFRDQTTPFGIRRFDRRRHLYLLGKSGNGKSCLIQLLAKSDIENGFGCAVLDPHGDLVDDILRLVPKHRAKDVVIFDPSDIQNPPSFNPMTPVNNEHKMQVVLGFLDTFKKAFGQGWSEKMDHLLRYAMIALLNVPGASIVSLRRLLSDDDYRNEVMKRNDDEAVRRFWDVEFTSRRQEFEEGPVSQLLNRLDELLATDMIRNVLGQPGNSFDFRDFIDNRKIVLFKLSKGIIGSENASFLGSLVIWKLYEAAMSRADIPVESRQDFYFYIDEFQNFTTSSFGEILSESRKYRLCLTFANQFLGQMPEAVKNTVFGNIANFICFRVGAEDAVTVSNEFKPRFAPEDALNLALREFYIKMSVDGEVQEAFSARTIDLYHPPGHEEAVRECINHSRAHYAVPISQAEEQLALSEIMSPRAMRAR